MLCPDVWNLPEPKYNYAISRGDHNTFRKKVSSGNFSEYITLVIPGNFPSPESVENVLLGSDSYIVHQVPVSEFLAPEFLEAYVKKGHFYGLSLRQETESECSVAVTPKGFLSIALNKDAFEAIQLTGKPIQTSRKFKDRYRHTPGAKCPNCVNLLPWGHFLCVLLPHGCAALPGSTCQQLQR